jgi:hypothetical protein
MIKDVIKEILNDDFLLLVATQVVFGLIGFMTIVAVVLLW